MIGGRGGGGRDGPEWQRAYELMQAWSPSLSVKAGLLALTSKTRAVPPSLSLALPTLFRRLSAGLEAGSRIPCIFIFWYLCHFRVRLLRKKHMAFPRKPAPPRIFLGMWQFPGIKTLGLCASHPPSQSSPAPLSLEHPTVLCPVFLTPVHRAWRIPGHPQPPTAAALTLASLCRPPPAHSLADPVSLSSNLCHPQEPPLSWASSFWAIK